MRFSYAVLIAPVVALATACSDSSIQDPTREPTILSATPSSSAQVAPGRFERYVAVGTSISMGWMSNGVYEGSQRGSWPAQLASAAGNPISLPLIQSPGCQSPIVAPLGAGRRLSGESILGSTVCAPNVAGTTLPTGNLGIASAIAFDATQTTPEMAAARGMPWFGRVLPAGTTQLAAVLSQRPRLVSVEFGGNEVLNATSGLVAPFVTYLPFPAFAGPYEALLNGIGMQGDIDAVLTGMPREARNLPALRRADEIWADRAEFAALNVTVSPDCQNSPNYINVSIKSLTMAFIGQASPAGHGPVFSCADLPGELDQVLTPDDISMINTLMASMSSYVQEQAAARGYAYFSLGALYDRGDLKPATYSVIAQLTTAQPYGPYISLDGVHPSAAGHAILAEAAGNALADRYPGYNTRNLHFSADRPASASLSPETPASAQSLLREWTERAGVRADEPVALCPMPGGCLRR